MMTKTNSRNSLDLIVIVIVSLSPHNYLTLFLWLDCMTDDVVTINLWWFHE